MSPSARPCAHPPPTRTVTRMDQRATGPACRRPRRETSAAARAPGPIERPVDARGPGRGRGCRTRGRRRIGPCGRSGPAADATVQTSAIRTAVTTTTTIAVPSLSPTEIRQARLAHYVNRARTMRGLRTYKVSASLSSVAQQQAQRMATSSGCSTTRTSRPTCTAGGPLGENVAYTSSVSRAHTLLMHSPPHRANLLSRTFTAGRSGCRQGLPRHGVGRGGVPQAGLTQREPRCGRARSRTPYAWRRHPIGPLRRCD